MCWANNSCYVGAGDIVLKWVKKAIYDKESEGDLTSEWDRIGEWIQEREGLEDSP